MPPTEKCIQYVVTDSDRAFLSIHSTLEEAQEAAREALWSDTPLAWDTDTNALPRAANSWIGKSSHASYEPVFIDSFIVDVKVWYYE